MKNVKENNKKINRLVGLFLRKNEIEDKIDEKAFIAAYPLHEDSLRTLLHQHWGQFGNEFIIPPYDIIQVFIISFTFFLI